MIYKVVISLEVDGGETSRVFYVDDVFKEKFIREVIEGGFRIEKS